MKLSIVIPLLNENHSLRLLYEQLDAVAETHGYELDVVFVDDGSTDSSWDAIRGIASSDQRVRGIRFRRNFGKAAALSAGFEAARGDLVFTLDADLQDDPAEIPHFVNKMATGLDVVSGWKKRRHDPWHRVLQSRLFNWIVSWLTGVRLHDHNCGFKCYRPEIFREVRLYGELHRFVPVLAAARGWRVGEIEVHHRPRQFGRSKFGWSRIPKGFLDVLTVKFLTGFGQRPQHLLGTVGLIGFVAGAVGITVLTLAWFLSRAVPAWEPVHLHERAIFYYSLAALLLGSQFMAVGFLAELITATQGHGPVPYSLAERTGDAEAWSPSRQSSPGNKASDDDASQAASGNAASTAASPDSAELP